MIQAQARASVLDRLKQFHQLGELRVASKCRNLIVDLLGQLLELTKRSEREVKWPKVKIEAWKETTDHFPGVLEASNLLHISNRMALHIFVFRSSL